MKYYLLPLIAMLSLTTMTGCKQDATVKVAVTYATMKYIDAKGPEAAVNRAARVAAVANQALNAIEGEGFELSQFTTHLVQGLPANLDPADRTLAVALISLIGDELTGRIGEGVLDEEKRVKVRAVLKWITQATSYYEAKVAGTLVHKRKIWRV